MKEKPETLEAFNYYFILGHKRTYEAVAKKFKRTSQTVFNWAHKLNWKERVEQRDINLAKGIEEETGQCILQAKSNYRAEINNYLKTLKNLMATALKKDKDGKTILNIKVESPRDAVAIISAYDKLTKLDLLLMGESTERTDEIITVTIED